MRILIAEDERITRMTLTRQLESWGHSVESAQDGEQAWERFQAGGFDIVVTDWEMPRLSGPEFVRRVRESPAAAYVYILMLTSRSDKADIVSGIEAGADDFVSKPFDREELRVRLLAGERIVKLERALTAQNAELRDANERIREGLRAAARIQRGLLPQQNISTPSARTAWEYVPTEELAGDALGLHLIDDRYLICYVLDVSGHGVPAALLSVTAMYAMDPMSGATSLLRDMLGTAGFGTVQRPGRVSTEMNRRFRAGEHDGRYFTMALCVLDTLSGKLCVTSAGHPPIHVMRGQAPIDVPDAGGLPIAIVEGSEYEDAIVQLKPGDRVYLYSDGLLEQPASTGSTQFGSGRLAALLAAQSGLPIGEAVERVVDGLAQWAGTRSFIDDVSLVVVEWLGP